MNTARALLFSVLAALAIANLNTTVSAQETRLLFTSLSPAGSANSIFFNQWAQRVNDQSSGVVKIEVRDGGTIANYANVHDRVQDDVVQIGWAIHQVLGGLFPLSEVAGLPFVQPGGIEASVALWRLYKSGLMDAEYKDIVPLNFVVFAPSQIHFAKSPKSIDDLSGMKIGVQGRVPSQLIGQLGGTAVSVQPGDMYDTLQRGTVDGTIISWSGFAPYKLQEVTTYHIETLLGQSTSMFFMSKKKYDALPAAVRKVLADNTGEGTTRLFAQHFVNQWNDSRAPVVASSKHTVVQLTPGQTEKWRSKAAPLLDEWATSRANGGKTLETYRSLFGQTRQ